MRKEVNVFKAFQTEVSDNRDYRKISEKKVKAFFAKTLKKGTSNSIFRLDSSETRLSSSKKREKQSKSKTFIDVTFINKRSKTALKEPLSSKRLDDAFKKAFENRLLNCEVINRKNEKVLTTESNLSRTKELFVPQDLQTFVTSPKTKQFIKDNKKVKELANHMKKETNLTKKKKALKLLIKL